MAISQTSKFPPSRYELYYYDETENKYKPIVNQGLIPISLKGSDIALPVDVQYSNLKVTTVTLANARTIRDTVTNWLVTSQDWSKYRRTVLRVTNTHNQPVKIFFNLQNQGDFYKLDGTRYEVTIPANSGHVLLTANDIPILGESFGEQIAIGGICTTAPTTGSITIVGYFTPFI